MGYAFPEESLQRAMSFNPHYIVVDGGSTDPGPYYLGSGTSHVTRPAVKRDLSLLLEAAMGAGIPLIIGSAGTAGGNPHVAWVEDILREIAAEKGFSFDLAVIRSEQPADYVLERLRAGFVRPLGPVPPLTEEQVRNATRIVGMMGPEPVMEALKQGAQVILAGRASDASIFAAPALLLGYPAGLAWHMGKILECGSAAAVPKRGSDGLIGMLRDDHFLVEPASPHMRCTVVRVAAHTLYENENPYLLKEPPGTLDTSASVYEQVDPRTVKVTGSQFRPADRYTVKLEGVEPLGYRSISILGIRDPILIAQIDKYLDDVVEMVHKRGLASPDDYKVAFRVYGKNGVMGSAEPVVDATPHELGILIEVVARTAELSSAILALTRTFMQVSDFPGRLCTSGNIAYPFSPNGFDVGLAYRFSIHHLIEPDDPCEMFPIEMKRIGG